jgi:four helix bundle protein
MASVVRFEELQLWQDARQLVKEVYAATSQGAFAKDFEMRGQIRAAALSSMNNIAEGFERGTNKEFAQFLNIAKGSAGEVRSTLYAALDQRYVAEGQFNAIRERVLVVSRRCSNLIKYLQGRGPAAPHSATQPYEVTT